MLHGSYISSGSSGDQQSSFMPHLVLSSKWSLKHCLNAPENIKDNYKQLKKNSN